MAYIDREALFYGAHRTAVTPTSENGRAIQYSGLMWDSQYRGGYMTEQFISTFVHEPLHRSLRETGHPATFMSRVYQETWNFYSSYPEYIPDNWDGTYY